MNRCARLLARARAWIAGAIVLGLALGACADLDRVAEMAFPPSVPGLADGQPWLNLPIGGWVNDGDTIADAIAACFAPPCTLRAGVGLFRAQGRGAALLWKVIERPETLKAQIEQADRTDKNARRKLTRVVVAVAPLLVGNLRGFTISMARSDGKRPVYGAVLAASRPDRSISFVLVVSDSDEAARRLAGLASAGLS